VLVLSTVSGKIYGSNYLCVKCRGSTTGLAPEVSVFGIAARL